MSEPEASVERVACLWCPDWAVTALRSRRPELANVPVAVVERAERGLVVRAASPEARAEGVTIGLRRREAESRCPGLEVVDADRHVEARAFERVVHAVEEITPRLVIDRPGSLTFPTRGPSRYFGGDEMLARHVVDTVGLSTARLGIADGRFAARLAARRAVDVEIVPPGEAAAFLRDWPVDALGDPDLASLLHRLGLRTLGAFAQLPAAAVVSRFGPDGERCHRLARGLDQLVAPPAPPPPELTETAELDPPAIHVESAAFVAHGLADRLLARLEALGLACTRVMIEAETEHGERRARCWRHEGALTPSSLEARVRWQLEGWLTSADEAGAPDEMPDVTAGLTLLRLVPDEVVAATGRQLGFWGGDPAAADRAGRALARVQGMLGHPAVVTAVPQGGRTPDERVRWVPWGDPREPARATEPPWPGTLPDPAPARILDPPAPAELLDAAARPVVVSGRGEVSAPPACLRAAVLDRGGGPVTTWAGPWPHDSRWWDGASRRRGAYWRVTVADVTCLVMIRGARATLEAIYD